MRQVWFSVFWWGPRFVVDLDSKRWVALDFANNLITDRVKPHVILAIDDDTVAACIDYWQDPDKCWRSGLSWFKIRVGKNGGISIEARRAYPWGVNYVVHVNGYMVAWVRYHPFANLFVYRTRVPSIYIAPPNRVEALRALVVARYARLLQLHGRRLMTVDEYREMVRRGKVIQH